MNHPPPIPPPPLTAQDESHLDLLSIFHFVVAGLSVLGLGFIILHAFFMFSILGVVEAGNTQESQPKIEVSESKGNQAFNGQLLPSTEPSTTREENPGKPIPEIDPDHIPTGKPLTEFPSELTSLISAMYFFFGLFTVLAAIGNFLAGLYLKKRKNRTFIMVVAGINCLQIPFGTVLGVFTIVVLSRPAVTNLFLQPSQNSRVE